MIITTIFWLLEIGLFLLFDLAFLYLGVIGSFKLWKRWRNNRRGIPNIEETGVDFPGYLMWVLSGFGMGGLFAHMILKIIIQGPISN